MKHPISNEESPLRILIFGGADILMKPIIHKVRENLPDSSETIIVGNRKSIGLTNLIRMEKRTGKFNDLIKEDRFTGYNFSNISDPVWNKSITQGLDNLERKSESFVWRHHKLKSIGDSLNYYYIVIDILTNFLKNEKVNLILYFEIPHLFVDTLVYQIAQAHGIKNLILSPSIFPNHFYSLLSVDDYGNLHSSPHVVVNQVAIDEFKANTEWKYMEGIKQHQGELGSLSFRGLLMLVANLIAVDPIKLFHIKFLFRTIKRMKRISSQLPKWRAPFKNYFDIRHLSYFETLLDFENTVIDLDSQFVYFPLQLQPELTTSSLGKDYSDQLLAVENLSRILPDECSIYIKENPKQGGQMRGEQFFNRLFRIKKARLIPSYISTHQLIEKSQFVAVITGTAGWEAICKGKSVVVFGQPWYYSFPGVFRFDDGISYEKVVNHTIDRKELNKTISDLYSRTHAGNIEPLKRRLSSGNYDTESNANLVAQTIVGLIEGHIETTFLP